MKKSIKMFKERDPQRETHLNVRVGCRLMTDGLGFNGSVLNQEGGVKGNLMMGISTCSKLM
jgi:hypothetical protein